jgi:hypothetical protein
MVRFFRIWGLASAAVLVAAVAAGQTGATSGDLGGIVRDPSQAVMPGVVVTVTDTATGVQRSGVTDGEGRYLIQALAPGTYRLLAEAPGFASFAQEPIAIALGMLTSLDVSMQPAGVTERVTVAAESVPVDLGRTGLTASVSRQQIETLPINIRNFISFSVITPGVTVDNTPQQGAVSTSGLTFAGQRARSNNITVDGLDNNDLDTGGVRATFSQEAVREFQVLTSAYSAEFGKASGGVVNIVTRSGTNEHGGNLFGYFRDETLNAKEYFERHDPAGNDLDRPKAPYGQTQVGATLGGPVRRDRAFYFLSFERLDIEANNFVTIDDTQVVSVFGQPAGTTVEILERAGFPIETGFVPYAVETSAFLLKYDQGFGQSDRLSVRLNLADGLNENIEPWGGLVARSRGGLLDSRDAMIAGSYTSVLSRHVVNELRAQFAFREQTVEPLDPTCDGRCDGFFEGGPTVEVSGAAFAGRQRFSPVPKTVDRVQLVDTYSYARGDHYVKAGFDFSRVSTEGALPAHFGGYYIFVPLPAIPGVLPAPISSIQALALGLPAAYLQGYGTADTTYTVTDLSLFAQDDWRLRPNLTLKAGVRYQRQFWPDRTYQARGLEPYSMPSDDDNIAPRLAIAWDPWNRGRTSFHGNYGMFFDNHITGLLAVVNLLNGAPDGIRTQVLRFPTTIAAWNAPGRQVPEGIAGPFPSLLLIPDPGLKTPFAHHVSAGVDQELGDGLQLSVNFLAVRGYNQLGTLDYNPLVPALGQGRRPEDDVVDGVAIPGSSTVILQYTAFGQTWYRGLTASLKRRLRDGLQFLVSYTLSKTEDNSADFSASFIPQDTGMGRDPANPAGLPRGFDKDGDRGPSLQDQRHRLVLSGLWSAPGEVNVSTIITLASGRPYNALAGIDLNGNGDGGLFPADRARRVPGDPSTSVMRNGETLPAQATVDLRLSRRFGLGGRASVDGVFDVFNLFNRTNFTEANNIFGVGAYRNSPLPTFGQFEKAGPPRQIQLGVRVNF